jgi:thiol:disulfide interchange protein DsbD
MEWITRFLSEMLSFSDGRMSILQAIVAVLIAYLGGILSSLTPCVYPMIPITVSVVGGIGPTRRNWRELLFRGLCYVGGMTLVYSFLGVLAGLTGRVFGSFTNTSSWYLALGAIMSIAALMMLDVIPFDPVAWIDRLKRRFHKKVVHSAQHDSLVQKEMTWIGSFLLGVSSGFIAAPCTTPVLTAILAYIAKTQSVGLGFFLMLSFSLGLGTLLLTIAAFAGAVQILPRSGQWMKSVKMFSGLILLAFAEYLIYRAGNFGGP